MPVNNEVDRMWVVNDPNEIIRCRSPQQEPFLRIRLPGGQILDMSFKLAQWLGWEAQSLKNRHEISAGTKQAETDARRRKHP